LLVITRRPGQTFRIGEEIEIKVLTVDGVVVRIGIVAAEAVHVFRSELHSEQRSRLLRARPSRPGVQPSENNDVQPA
jgi:carbon storage regulator